MGITSLSHIAIVAVVIAVTFITWKLRLRRASRALGQPAPAAASASSASPWTFLKGVALAALFSGAMLPMFSTDGFAPAIHMACTAALTVLAALWLFRKT